MKTEFSLLAMINSSEIHVLRAQLKLTSVVAKILPNATKVYFHRQH